MTSENQRQAQCPYCKTLKPSNSEGLSFFEDRSEGSEWAKKNEPRQYDSFYCGCFGWD